MPSHSGSAVTVHHPTANVHAAFTSRDYWAFIAKHLSGEPGEVAEFTGDLVTLYEVLPQTLLPESVQALVSHALKVKRVIQIGPLGSNGAELSYSADLKATPVDFSGTITLTGAGETTELVYDNEVTVNIPFMGPAIEPNVAAALKDLFTREGELTQKWITENL